MNRVLLTHPASPRLFFSICFASAISQELNLATQYTIFRPLPFFETFIRGRMLKKTHACTHTDPHHTHTQTEGGRGKGRGLLIWTHLKYTHFKSVAVDALQLFPIRGKCRGKHERFRRIKREKKRQNKCFSRRRTSAMWQKFNKLF